MCFKNFDSLQVWNDTLTKITYKKKLYMDNNYLVIVKCPLILMSVKTCVAEFTQIEGTCCLIALSER